MRPSDNARRATMYVYVHCFPSVGLHGVVRRGVTECINDHRYKKYSTIDYNHSLSDERSTEESSRRRASGIFVGSA